MTEGKNEYSVMILAKDKESFDQISSHIDYNDLRLYLLPHMTNEQEAVETLKLLRPNIVIADEDVLVSITVEKFIRSLPNRFSCRVLVLYEDEPKISLVSSRLPAGADVKKKNLQASLPRHLERAVERLDWNISKINYVYEATRLYFNTIFLQSISSTQSIDVVNQAFGFTFQEGLFRVIIIKLDYDGDPRTVYGRLFPLQNEIEELIYTRFMKHCHQLVLSRTFDGVIMTMNWSKDEDQAIVDLLAQIADEIRDLCNNVAGIRVTLCMGGIYDTFADVCRSRNDAHNVHWGRLVLNKNKILCHHDCAELQFPLHLEAKYDTLGFRFRKAFRSLDIKSFTECADEAFNAPDRVLGSPHMCSFFHNTAIDFFRIQHDELEKFGDVEMMRNKTVYILVMQPSLRAYKDAFISEITDLMEQIKYQNNKDYSWHVQSAIIYIRDHYTENLTLTSIADHIGISASYLSSVFKAETGTGLSNYLGLCRIQAACQLLRQSNDSVAEIAVKVNIMDTTYFGKQFRKHVSMTPSEYRKIFR